MKSVTVPASFWVKTGRRDYSDPAAAWLREALQNARDAGARRVDISVGSSLFAGGGGGGGPSAEGAAPAEGGVSVEVTDDGSGMTAGVIEGSLMALGESTKSAAGGDTGGFGVAKILLFFAQTSYEIWTGDLYVSGSGSTYGITKASSRQRGTRVRVVLNPEVVRSSPEALSELYRREVSLSCLTGLVVRLNGSEVAASLSPGRLAADLGGGVRVYKQRLPAGLTSSRASVRVRGLHMFWMWTAETAYRLTVELSAYSPELLTTNRDGLRGEWSTRVNAFVQSLAINSSAGESSKITLWRGGSSRRSGLKSESLAQVLGRVNSLLRGNFGEASLTAGQGGEHGEGGELGSRGTSAELMAEMVEGAARQAGADDREVARLLGLVAARTEAAKAAVGVGGSGVGGLGDGLGDGGGGGSLEFTDITEKDMESDEAGRPLTHHYYVETRGKFRRVPARWQPGNFTPRQTGLLELWARVVSMVLLDAGSGGSTFDVGFLVEDGSVEDSSELAAYVSRGGGHIFLLNPLRYGGERKLPPLRSADMIHYLVSLATHEVTHRLGYGGHNQSFVSAEAETRRKVMKNYGSYLKLRLKS